MRLGEKVTIYTHGNEAVNLAIKALIATVGSETKTATNISVDDRKITKFVKGSNKGELTIFFADGEYKFEGFLAHKPKGELNGPWKEQLGLETTSSGDFKVSFPFNETSVLGVFAAGDCSTVMKAVGSATYGGSLVAAGVATSIGAED